MHYIKDILLNHNLMSSLALSGSANKFQKFEKKFQLCFNVFIFAYFFLYVVMNICFSDVLKCLVQCVIVFHCWKVFRINNLTQLMLCEHVNLLTHVESLILTHCTMYRLLTVSQNRTGKSNIFNLTFNLLFYDV